MPEGIYNSNSLLVETERQMMSCGQEIMIVADHTQIRPAGARAAVRPGRGRPVRDRLGLKRRKPRACSKQAGVAIHVAPVVENRTNGALFEPSRGDSSRNDA